MSYKQPINAYKSRFFIALGLVFLVSGCAGRVFESHSRAEGSELPACPPSPNCVNSEVDTEHFVKPFVLEGDTATAWQQIRDQVIQSKRTTVVFEQADFIHAEVVSPLRVYTDDLVLRLDAENNLVHLRSSSRLGYYDFGVNRDRVEALRSALVERGAIAP